MTFRQDNLRKRHNETNINPRLFAISFGRRHPQKALMTAIVVGTILTTINHGDEILKGESFNYIKIILTYCVPYCVTTWGAIHGKRAQFLVDHSSN